MSSDEFIIGLFVRVDDAMLDVPLHPQGLLYPSEMVTIGLWYALKGGRPARLLSPAAAGRYRAVPLPARADPLVAARAGAPGLDAAVSGGSDGPGGADTYGMELVHPWREHRNPVPVGEKGLSNHRWIVGAKLAIVLNKWGLVCGWDADAANVHDSRCHGLIRRFDGAMIVLTDQGPVSSSGNPANMKPVKKGTWNDRMLVETFYSMLTVVCHSKKMTHRVWEYFCMRLAFLVALFNILVQWEGLPLDDRGCGHRSIAPFSL